MSLSAFNFDKDIVKRHGSDFSITERLHEYMRNYDWQAGFNSVIENSLPRDENGKIRLNDCPENSALWVLLSATFEPVASEIYEKMSSIVKRTTDIDVCNIDSLYSITNMFGVEGSRNINISYPLEIKSLIEIFSTNKSKVMFFTEMLLDENIETISEYISTTTSADMMSGFDISATTFVKATSTFVNDWSDSQRASIESLSTSFVYENHDLYIEFMERQFYTVFDKYINDPDFLQVYYDKIYIHKEKTSSTILDTGADEESIAILKVEYYIPENFSAKYEADSIISGRRLKSDYTDTELIVINAEIERRSQYEKYGADPYNRKFRRFKYEHDRKFREFILFVEDINIINKSVSLDTDYSHNLMEINVDDYKFFDYYDDVAPPLTGGVPVSGDMLESTVHYLRNLCLDTFYRRERVRTSAQKFKHIGTSEIIEIIISDYIYKNFSEKNKWNFHEFPELSAYSPSFSAVALGGDITNNITGDAVYNNVRVIEYVDQTDYFNLDSGTPASEGESVSPRYWENESIVSSSDATSTDFYNFYKNLGMEGTYEEIKTFIEKVYAMGAVSATLPTISSDIIDSSLSGFVEGNMSGMYLKYFGNTSGDIPWINKKNNIHPSVAIHPFLWSLQEYDSLIFSLASIYNNVAETSSDIISSLYRRIDENGSLINLWHSDAVTMGSYEDFYQHSPNFDRLYTENEKIDYDGPFIFEALEDYLAKYNDGGFTTLNIDDFFDEWYGHLEVSIDLKNKIKWQLQTHITNILSVANKYIYQFSVDKYGTQYILFKDSLNYSDGGELWVRYKNHPLAFPFSEPLTSTYQQIDITSFYDENEEFYNASKQVFDFKLMTLGRKIVLLAHTAGPSISNPIPSRSGVLYYMSLGQNNNSDNTFYSERLVGNNWFYHLESDSTEYVGIYKSASFDGDVFGIVSRLGYTSAETFSADIDTGTYNWKYRFKVYDELHGITTYNKNVLTEYPLYNTLDENDLHNRYTLNRHTNSLSIVYESVNSSLDAEPYLYNGTSNNGKFNTEYNVAKQMYHNGITLIDFAMGTDDKIPSSNVVKYYNGYNDIGYHSIEAWEGYIGSEHPLISGDPVGQLSTELQLYDVNSDKYIGMEFLGMSDPSTSARFDIDTMQFLCYNSNEEYLGLYVGNIYPTWNDATFAWGSKTVTMSGIDFTKWAPLSANNLVNSEYPAWNGKTSLFKLFEEPNETWYFAMLGSDNIYYNVTITYTGRGCQKFTVDMQPNEKLNKGIGDDDFAVLNSKYFVYSSHYASIVDIDPPVGSVSGTITVDLLNINKYDIFRSPGTETTIIQEDDGTTETGLVSGDDGPNQIIFIVDDVSIYTLYEKISLTQPAVSELLLESFDGSVLLESGTKLLLET